MPPIPGHRVVGVVRGVQIGNPEAKNAGKPTGKKILLLNGDESTPPTDHKLSSCLL